MMRFKGSNRKNCKMMTSHFRILLLGTVNSNIQFTAVKFIYLVTNEVERSEPAAGTNKPRPTLDFEIVCLYINGCLCNHLKTISVIRVKWYLLYFISICKPQRVL